MGATAAAGRHAPSTPSTPSSLSQGVCEANPAAGLAQHKRRGRLLTGIVRTQLLWDRHLEAGARTRLARGAVHLHFTTLLVKRLHLCPLQRLRLLLEVMQHSSQPPHGISGHLGLDPGNSLTRLIYQRNIRQLILASIHMHSIRMRPTHHLQGMGHPQYMPLTSDTARWRPACAARVRGAVSDEEETGMTTGAAAGLQHVDVPKRRDGETGSRRVRESRHQSGVTPGRNLGLLTA
mmetsp:Transcript_41280/g.95922  ORF Transcript_41280/g.95922 Transcript_41280/m.95922 type:complete len:235 (-) Transcript_41280:855-1559(-)